MENKLMEERLMQLKMDLQNQKQKAKSREEGGGSIWSKGQVGLVTTYAKNVTNPDSIHNKDSILNKVVHIFIQNYKSMRWFFINCYVIPNSPRIVQSS